MLGLFTLPRELRLQGFFMSKVRISGLKTLPKVINKSHKNRLLQRLDFLTIASPD
jgi:hypothetical protein